MKCTFPTCKDNKPAWRLRYFPSIWEILDGERVVAHGPKPYRADDGAKLALAIERVFKTAKTDQDVCEIMKDWHVD